MSGTVDDVVGDVLDDEADAEDEQDDESGPAEDFGLKVGLPVAAIAGYLLVLSQYRVLALSPAPDDLFLDLDAGADPFFYVAVSTLALSFVGALLYAAGEEIYDGYRGDFAIGAILAPAAVIVLVFAAFLLEPVLNAVLAGDFAGALLVLVVELIVVAVLLSTSLGIIALVIFFGLYLGLPSFVGTYAGAIVGELVRNDSG